MGAEGLLLNDFDLKMGTFADDNGCTVNALSEGTQWGNAEPVTTVMTSMMRDGDSVRQSRSGNRLPTVRVVIEGPTLADVSATERDLALHVGKPGVLAWQPPDEFAEVCVFDVVWSKLDHEMDDLDETRYRRTFLLSFQALPFSRAADLTVTPALLAPPGAITTATITDGSNLSGWSATATGTEGEAWPAGVSTVSGVMRAAATPPVSGRLSAHAVLMAQRSAVVNTAGTPFVTIRVRLSGSGLYDIVGGYSVRFDGVDYTPISANGTPDGYAELTYLVGPHTTVQIRATVAAVGASTTGFDVDSITMSSHAPASSTRKQLSRTVTVGGSARTQGSIQIDGSGVGLGDLLVMTWPLSVGPGYRPALHPFRTGGSSRSTDATLYSGGYAQITTPSLYTVPISALPLSPQGDECPIWARLRVATTPTGPGTITVSAQAYQGATPVGSPITQTVVVDLLTDFNLIPLCSMPATPVPLGSAGHVVYSITGTSPGVNVELDDLYIGPPGGSVTAILNVGTSRVWIDAPSLEQPFGGLWAGELANRSDARSAQEAAVSWQFHDFDPEGVGMFTACNVPDAIVTLEHYRRFHTHVSAA